MNGNQVAHNDSPCIETQNLSLYYGKKTAFEGISLSVPREAVMAIIGPSGCGKSSFLMCLSRLIDLVPGARVSGGINLGNLDVLKPQTDVVDLRRRVGMIFQKPNPFPLSIRRNLELPLREHITRDRRKMEQIIEETLKNVGLWNEVKDRLDRSALSLSGGQQQRLCLARTLVLQPEVLLLDEPCSALDPLATGVIEELISQLKNRLTILIVTHNLAQARRVADQAALFWIQNQCGYLIESGPVGQIFEDPQQATTAAYVSGQAG